MIKHLTPLQSNPRFPISFSEFKRKRTRTASPAIPHVYLLKELRSPLTSILLAADLLDEATLNPEQQQFLQIIRNNCKSINQQLNTLLFMQETCSYAAEC